MGKATLKLFYAKWCHPCRAMQDILAQIVADFGDAIHVVKIDIEKESPQAFAAHVTTLPTLIIQKTDGRTRRMVGLRSKEEVIKELRA